MADEIQEKMLEAIDVLINNRLNQLDSNTTTIATITGVLNSTGTEYSCEGNGDNFNAISSMENSFAIGDSVYVLMSKEKNIILGKADSEETVEASLATQNNYYPIGGNFIALENYTNSIGICSYKKTDSKIIYEYGNENNLIDISELELAKFTKYIEEANALMLQATFQTNLPNQQIKDITGVYGLRVVLNFEQKINNEEIITWTKTLYLNSSTMSGNPYRYTSPNKQYMIFNLNEAEGQYFKNIQSIEFIGGNFVAITDPIETDDNIFCSNIKITCLDLIEKLDNSYYILIDAPSGACFNSAGSSATAENLTITATAYFNETNISSICSYAWFIEDGRINEDSANYRAIAGPGWRYIGSENISKNFSALDNQVIKTNYLCVATYNNEINIRQPFSLFNIAENLSKIKVLPENGIINFSFNINSNIDLICSVDGKTEFEDDGSYSFIWYEPDNNNFYSQIKNKEIAENDYSEEEKQNLSVQNELKKYENIKLNLNRLSYPIKNKNSQDKAVFICQVYHNDIFIGQADITLSNLKSSLSKNIIINNGNQVFQYTEEGISPCSESLSNPQEILPLTAQVFDLSGNPISNGEIQSVIWNFPLTDSSLIVPPIEAKISNQNNSYSINTTVDKPVYFTIKPTYNVNDINNQIQVTLLTSEGSYVGTTNFIFTKIGNFENNGTNFIAKITPIEDIENLTLFLQKDKIKGSNIYDDVNQISINIKYKQKNASPELLSVVNALQTLENISTRRNKCRDWAEYIQQTYLKQSNISLEKKSACRNLYLDLRQVSNGQKTVDELLFDYLDDYQSEITFSHWNVNDIQNDIPRLKVKLYKSGIEINPNKVKWSILGSTTRSKYLEVSAATDFSECIVSARSNLNSNKIGIMNNLIVQAQVTYRDNENKENVCYAVYPINVVILNNGKTLPEDFSIVEKQTLRSVMYNRDGNNPIYNMNLGVSLKNIGEFSYRYWIPEGGSGDSSATAPMTIEEESTDSLFRKIIPNNTYSGEYGNTNVHIILYQPEQNSNFDNLTSIYKEYGKPKVDIYIPIHFYLNTHELSSLNSWDGNHLEINEEENYILAPQIGVGRKEGNNSFTGLVLGEAKYYDDVDESTGELQPSSSIGLLGYSRGKQSIFLDAETGAAVFGLPEQRASAENSSTEGRIVINPGGESKIGMWTIGSRALYNINKGLQKVDKNGNPILDNTSSKYVDSVGYNPNLLKGSYLNNNDISKDYFNDEENLDMTSYGYAPYFRYYKNEGWASSGKGAYDIKNASVMIPPDAQGLVLSANPSFISAKTMPLKYTPYSDRVNTIEEDSNGDRYLLTDIELGEGDTVLQQGDSLEVQINPNSTSPFGVFRHTRYPITGVSGVDYPENYNGKYYRYPLMGINHNGQLFVNSLQNGETNLRVGQVEAFGFQTGGTAENSPYLGHKFIYTDNSNNERIISKMFINKLNDSGNNLSPLYITTGQDQMNEYSRPISIHGKTISLYASQQADKDILTSHRLVIKDDNIEIGHLEVSDYVAANRTVVPTQEKINGWDVYEDANLQDFKYFGKLFETCINTTYTSNGVNIQPGLEYYVNTNDFSDIKQVTNSSLIKITRDENTTFENFGDLTIAKVCIPVHWNKNGIIDSVYVPEHIVNDNDEDLDQYECYYYNASGSCIVNSKITVSALIGERFSSVLKDIVKIILLPANYSNFEIEQLDLNKNFDFNLDEDDGSQEIQQITEEGGISVTVISPDYPLEISDYTLQPDNLEEAVEIPNNSVYEPPMGYFVYRKESNKNIPLSNIYVGNSNIIFINQSQDCTSGAFVNTNLYWLQTVTASFLREHLSNTATMTASIPISNFALSGNNLTSAIDVCGNDWSSHLNLISKDSNTKNLYNYFNIANNKNGNITNSVLNLPTNNFSMKVQQGLFNLTAAANKAEIIMETTKGLRINTANNTATVSYSQASNEKDQYNALVTRDAPSNLNLAEIFVGRKKNTTAGYFILRSRKKIPNKPNDDPENILSQIWSNADGKLHIESKGKTEHISKNGYWLRSLTQEGILLRACVSDLKESNAGTSYLQLKPNSITGGECTLRGGNNSISETKSGISINSISLINISGPDDITIANTDKSAKNIYIKSTKNMEITGNNYAIVKGKNSFMKFFKHSTLNKDIIQTNVDLYLSYNNKRYNLYCKDIDTSGGIVSAGNIIAGKAGGKAGVSLSSHTHPFNMAGSISFYRAGQAPTTRTVWTKKLVYMTTISVRCENDRQTYVEFYRNIDTAESYNIREVFPVAGNLVLRINIISYGHRAVNADTESQTFSTGGYDAIQSFLNFSVNELTKLSGHQIQGNGFTLSFNSASLGAPINPNQ